MDVPRRRLAERAETDAEISAGRRRLADTDTDTDTITAGTHKSTIVIILDVSIRSTPTIFYHFVLSG